MNDLRMVPVVNLVLNIALSIILGFIAFEDLKIKKIRNQFTLGLFICAIFWRVFNYQDFQLWDLAIPGCVLVIGFLLFLAQVVGAGDVKLLSALLCFVDFNEQIVYLKALALCTGFIALLRLLYQMWITRSQVAYSFITFQFKALKNLLTSNHAYAPVIFIAWIYYLLVQEDIVKIILF